jgi:hypothetical protein
MEESSQIAWIPVPLRHFFPLKVVPLIEVLLYRSDEWKQMLLNPDIRNSADTPLH